MSINLNIKEVIGAQKYESFLFNFLTGYFVPGILLLSSTHNYIKANMSICLETGLGSYGKKYRL